jgi:uncharacterized protein YcgI (DUF1989 family)
VNPSHTVPGDAGWSLRLPRGYALRLECLGEGGNASMLAYAAADPVERLNIPDTLKAQMSGCVRPPMVLMSGHGRAMCSVVSSTMDWHDAVTGYGPAAGGLLLDELATLGLGRRDVHATVNWFSKVAPDPAGTLGFVPGHARSGDSVTLRAERDLLLVLCTARHPLDPDPAPAPALRATVSPAGPVPGDDPSWTFRAEATRALTAVALLDVALLDVARAAAA